MEHMKYVHKDPNASGVPGKNLLGYMLCIIQNLLSFFIIFIGGGGSRKQIGRILWKTLLSSTKLEALYIQCT